MRKVVLYLLGALCSISLAAQDEVAGVIIDAAGSPAKNVKLRLNGLIKATKTNAKGIFKLKKIMENDTLLVYPSEELIVKIPLRPNVFLSLQLTEYSLHCKCDTTTVTYMYQRAPKISYSSNIITQRQIQNLSPTNLIELLRGRVPGLQIQQMDGASKASIRGGVSSMSLNTEPLFVIGSSQYETLESANNAISVDNIREVEIKKDGSEFGMKGANGVIIVRTK